MFAETQMRYRTLISASSLPKALLCSIWGDSASIWKTLSVRPSTSYAEKTRFIHVLMSDIEKTGCFFMRSRIAHGYAKLKPEIIWETATVSISGLLDLCTQILADNHQQFVAYHLVTMPDLFRNPKKIGHRCGS